MLKTIPLDDITGDQINNLVKLETFGQLLAKAARLNNSLPSRLQLPKDDFLEDVNSEHIQSLYDFEFPFCVPEGGVEKLLEYHMHLFKDMLRQRNIKVDNLDILDNDSWNISVDPSGFDFEPGIYRLRINLLSNWTISVGNVRNMFIKYMHNLKLAGISEILSAMTLNPDIFLVQNGRSFPFFTAGGTNINRGDNKSNQYTVGFSGVDRDRLYVVLDNISATSDFKSSPALIINY